MKPRRLLQKLNPHRQLQVLALCASLVVLNAGAAMARVPDYDADELARILSLGPWPPAEPTRRDPTNRVSQNPLAIEFGKRLFNSTKLSINQKVSCGTCHKPALGFSDGRVRAQGLGRHDRNSQSLWNVDLQRWFGWDGGADSLWSASIRPILTRHEMGSNAQHVQQSVLQDRDWREQYRRLFGAIGSPEEVLVNVGKSLAAYLETLRSPPTAFDRFRDAVAAGQSPDTVNYSAAARRGLKIFVGRGNCTVCHFGPGLSNGEFHDVAIPFLIEPGRVDSGRYSGVRRVKADPFNLLSAYNDQSSTSENPSGNPSGSQSKNQSESQPERLPESLKTNTVQLVHRNWGEWKTPSLRNLKTTAPYMHNGSLRSLRDVARHYSEINEERLHSDGERLLKPLRLSTRDINDLVAFLLSLSP